MQWEIFRAVFDVSGGPEPALPHRRSRSSRSTASAAPTWRPTSRPATPSRPARRRTSCRSNFRSSPAVIEAENAHLRCRARSPVLRRRDRLPAGRARAAGRAAAPAPDGDGPPIALLRVAADDESTAPHARRPRGAGAAPSPTRSRRCWRGPAPPAASEIFVLTRTRAESKTVGDALTARGIPHVLYNQEGLYETAEAAATSATCCAPSRIRTIPRSACAPGSRRSSDCRSRISRPRRAGGDQTLVDRLLEWHALGRDRGSRPPLRPASSTTAASCAASCSGARASARLTNYPAPVEVLLGRRARAPLAGDLARRLSALVAKLVVPTPEEGNQLRAEGERDAVQIMTLHKAKGLEADVVFLYGGFWPRPGDLVRSYTIDRPPHAAGRAAAPPRGRRPRQPRAGRGGPAPLLRGAHARPPAALPPLLGQRARPGGAESDGSERGGLLEAHGRLPPRQPAPARARRRSGVPTLFGARDVPVNAAARTTRAPRPPPRALAAWRPDPADLAELDARPGARARCAARAPARRRRRTAGSSRRTAATSRRPRCSTRPSLAATAVAELDRRDELPGGARSGIFLHDAARAAAARRASTEAPELEAWARAPRRPRAVRPAAAQARPRSAPPRPGGPAGPRGADRAAPVVGGTLPGLARAARVARELEFLFPFPAAAGGADRGFVKGYVDVIFEHEGRTYFGDWKTDRLPAWDAETVAAHVDANYALQERLYALALVPDARDRRRGRLRGALRRHALPLPARRCRAAIRSRRPSYAEIERWRGELARGARRGAGDAQAGRRDLVQPDWARGLRRRRGRRGVALPRDGGRRLAASCRRPGAARSRCSCSPRSTRAPTARRGSGSARCRRASRGWARRPPTATTVARLLAGLADGAPRRGRSRRWSAAPATTARSSSTAAPSTTSAITALEVRLATARRRACGRPSARSRRTSLGPRSPPPPTRPAGAGRRRSTPRSRPRSAARSP